MTRKRVYAFGARSATLLGVAVCLSRCSFTDFDSLSAGLAGDQLQDNLGGSGGTFSEPDASAGSQNMGGGSNGGSSGFENGGSGGASPPDAGNPVDEPEAGAPQNLLADPGFEEGTPRWTPMGGAQLLLSTDNPHDGNSCLLATNRLQYRYEGPGYELLGIVEPGTTYTVSVWVRMPEGYEDTAVVNFTFKNRCLDDTGAEAYTNLLPAAQVNASWTKVEATWTTAPCQLGIATLYVEGPPIGDDFYIDDASLIQLP